MNWSSTQTPDCRDPLPDFPFPPNGRCASAPEVELLTLTMPAEMPRLKRNASAASRVYSDEERP